DRDERDRLRVGEDGRGETLALGRRKALRIIQVIKIAARAGGEPLQVEENPRGHDRTGQRSAAHLVDAGDQAKATTAVIAKEVRVAHRVGDVPTRSSYSSLGRTWMLHACRRTFIRDPSPLETA